MGLRMQPRSEKFFTLTEFVAAPHGRWAELAKRMCDTEHAGDDTTKEADQTLPAELVPGNVSNPGDSVDCSPTTGIDGPKRRSWPEKFRLGRGSDGARLA